MSAELNELAAKDRRIIDRLDRSGECWLWTGPLDDRGRGRVFYHGRPVLHHRAVWEILVGPIPPGALLCHHCDNPTCANPAHIYVGDSSTNVEDMRSRGRAWSQIDPKAHADNARKVGLSNTWSRGSNNPKAKLSPEQVSEIRSSAGSSYAVAKNYGVDASTVQRIRKGTQWPSSARSKAASQ